MLYVLKSTNRRIIRQVLFVLFSVISLSPYGWYQEKYLKKAPRGARSVGSSYNYSFYVGKHYNLHYMTL
jgi:hypothetical protein